MRRNLKRYYGAGDLHFITCSCYQRRPLLGTPQRRDLFLSVLERMRIRYQFVVVGYVIMPEHIHLLISEPQEKNPSTVMQALKLGFARRVLVQSKPQAKRRVDAAQTDLIEHVPQRICPQRVWQKRFYDFNVWTEHKRVEKLGYMHRNPVQRGLVESPELCRWSSYRACSLGEAGPVKINGWEVLKMKMPSPAA
jgi:putative transposase